MKHLLLLFLLSIHFSLSATEHKYNLVVGSMFKNEAPWLKEWIEYHRIIGVEHFYLYNNDSDDNYREILEPYMQAGIVELVDWSSRSAPWHTVPPPQLFVGYQLSAFNDCIKRSVGTARWVAIIDIDEYIVPLHGIRAFHALLDKALTYPLGSLIFRWKCYGTSHLWDIPQGKLMTEMLTLRTEDKHPANKLTKSIHRPEAIEYCHVHEASALKKGYHQTVIRDIIRINHYQQRGIKDVLLKRHGVSANSPEAIPLQVMERLKRDEDLFNKIEDPAIGQYLPQLKKAMGMSDSLH